MIFSGWTPKELTEGFTERLSQGGSLTGPRRSRKLSRKAFGEAVLEFLAGFILAFTVWLWLSA